ncbi:hypothetical protein F4553_005327 [Allocatelliglobosispora scoriae]|uniref:Uncharacterized protein n=1 Tax=Allocatelliglobosispora scoriae TaxID=643052 RepID=A0A841BWT4_9ACTN|nr:hypothetical protein [Allocatelliglobosispora scoriae]MBB5871948.1 hypothetical protein [Allocatelliglobosispora scoriae]
MSNTAPWHMLCNCRCPLHHGFERTDYFQPGCACAITCDTQPMTLLAEQWGCALFLDRNGDLWHVNAMANGQWDWEHGGEIDTRADTYDDNVDIERLLREAACVLRTYHA